MRLNIKGPILKSYLICFHPDLRWSSMLGLIIPLNLQKKSSVTGCLLRFHTKVTLPMWSQRAEQKFRWMTLSFLIGHWTGEVFFWGGGYPSLRFPLEIVPSSGKTCTYSLTPPLPCVPVNYGGLHIQTRIRCPPSPSLVCSIWPNFTHCKSNDGN